MAGESGENFIRESKESREIGGPIEWYSASTTESIVNSAQKLEKLLKKYNWPEEEIFSVACGFSDLLTNAVVHGNFEIKEKKPDLGWADLIKQGSEKKENLSKKVHISIKSINNHKVVIEIQDEGKDSKSLWWKDIADPEAEENLLKNSGRGIHMAKNLFNEVEFEKNENGTKVTIVKDLSKRSGEDLEKDLAQKVQSKYWENVKDIAQAHTLEELDLAESESATDYLTGLLNKRAFIKEMKVRLKDGGKIGLLFLDIDDFKQFNDKYGHAVGDEILKNVASKLKYIFRAGDVVGRWGGDEFVVAFPGGDANTAQQRFTKEANFSVKIEAGRRIGDTVLPSNLDLYVTLSGGANVLTIKTGENISIEKALEDAVQDASLAKNEAKKRPGKNNVVRFRKRA